MIQRGYNMYSIKRPINSRYIQLSDSIERQLDYEYCSNKNDRFISILVKKGQFNQKQEKEYNENLTLLYKILR